MESKFIALEKPGKLREFFFSYFVATLKKKNVTLKIFVAEASSSVNYGNNCHRMKWYPYMQNFTAGFPLPLLIILHSLPPFPTHFPLSLSLNPARGSGECCKPTCHDTLWSFSRKNNMFHNPHWIVLNPSDTCLLMPLLITDIICMSLFRPYVYLC